MRKSYRGGVEEDVTILTGVSVIERRRSAAGERWVTRSAGLRPRLTARRGSAAEHLISLVAPCPFFWDVWGFSKRTRPPHQAASVITCDLCLRDGREPLLLYQRKQLQRRATGTLLASFPLTHQTDGYVQATRGYRLPSATPLSVLFTGQRGKQA